LTVSGVVAGCLLGGFLVQALAQGIFTCDDASGRRLTSDRPIVQCIDREQRELTPSGTVKRKIGPTLTAAERAAEEEKLRQAQAERSRLAEEKRRDRALMTRYPDKAAHDKERGIAIAQADDIIASARKRTQELAQERKRLDLELEFFKSDPSRVPPKLRRQIQENAEQTEAQKRFVSTQEEEKRRINARFDEELGKLKHLWAQRSAPTTAKAAASAPVRQ
jgi:hypothetical protein